MAVPHNVLEKFPKLSKAFYEKRLARPRHGARVIIDTDTANEIDDQYALAWALLSGDKLTIEGVSAVPFSFAHLRHGVIENYEKLKHSPDSYGPDSYGASFTGGLGRWERRLLEQNIDPRDFHFFTTAEGAELSYQEIINVFGKCHRLSEDNLVWRGSESYLQDWHYHIESEAAQGIIDKARASDTDDPLYILAIGGMTNIAAALLWHLILRAIIVVVSTSSYPSYAPFAHDTAFNLIQDVMASQLVFACGVPHVYLPCNHVGVQLSISLPEMERFVRGQGDIGNYLHHLYVNNPLHKFFAITNTATKTWVMWDMLNVAWMLDVTYVNDFITASPLLSDDLLWHHRDDSHPLREAFALDRDAIFEDFYQCLQNNARTNAPTTEAEAR